MTMLLQRPSSILLLLGFLLLHEYSCMLQLKDKPSSNFTDQLSLIAFKSKIIFRPNDTFLSGNWSTSTNFCNWIGISCSRRRQRVTSLNISYMGLQGTISPHIGNLSFLVSLDLSNNSFSGFLPHQISHLRRLRILSMGFNNFEGTIPPSLHQCRQLTYLALSGNKLSGGISKDLRMLSKLRGIHLSMNRLSGPLPFDIFNISSLTILALTENHISGTLPMDICSHSPNLNGVYLSDNEFSGPLPSQMNNCTELVDLSLSYNKFEGSIAKAFGSLPKLERLYLGANNLTGNIPSTISNLSRLHDFYIERNNIKGPIPSDLWRLSNLNLLNLQMNNLTGVIPQQIFNISSLQLISFMENSLHGNLQLDTELSCPDLEILILGNNKLSGCIPSSLSNCSSLARVDLNLNLLSGPIPRSLGSLNYLQRLYLGNNQLTGEPGDQGLNFLSSFSNSIFLEVLSISNNPLDITIPDSIGNLSDSLTSIYAYQSQIKGHIPAEMGSLKALIVLDLGSNNLSGNIPTTFGRLERLQRLYLDGNKIEGFIPEDLCQLKNLGELFLSKNKISESIPNCISNLSLLTSLNLSSNRLKSPIPSSIWSLESMLFLDLSLNSLVGYLSPNMNKLEAIEYVDLSRNQVTGNIPQIIGTFESLSYLDLSKNSFQGDIPQSFGDLKGLDSLNLSCNNLSGAIPKSLEALPHLKYLNLSFNKLSGEIPSGGPFANFTPESFSGNRALCGNPIFGVPPCPNPSSQGSRMKRLLLRYIIPAIASIILIFITLVYMLRKHRESNMQVPSLVDTLHAFEHRMISYQELCQGTNNFNESNLLGIGGFGSVYKCILSDGTIVAVKVLNLQLIGASLSFDAECKVLRTIRHRNLVKVISTCSNPEFRALALQYMSNGNLERWLYSHSYCLNLHQRVNIMIDVASALDYLHHGQLETVVHCDLKPSNILLDEDMVAHVGDFGIAKILVKNEEAKLTKTLGTLGYIAPEYGSEGKVSIKCDVYSYGIILLEMITKKKPTNEMFAGELTLRQWINASLPEGMMEVVDDDLLRMEDGTDETTVKSILLSIMELGLKCSTESPNERIDIKDVVVKLNKIKLAFF